MWALSPLPMFTYTSYRGPLSGKHGWKGSQWGKWGRTWIDPKRLVGRGHQRILLGSAWNPDWYRIDNNCCIQVNGLLVGGQFYGEYNGKQSILVLRSYHPAITLLHFTGVFWSDCRHSYSLVVSDFVSHMALDFWKDSLCKRRRRVTYHVP